MEGRQVGWEWGFEQNGEATVYPATPEELARRRQATSGTMMAFELEGLFDEEVEVSVESAVVDFEDPEDEGDNDDPDTAE